MLTPARSATTPLRSPAASAALTGSPRRADGRRSSAAPLRSGQLGQVQQRSGHDVAPAETALARWDSKASTSACAAGACRPALAGDQEPPGQGSSPPAAGGSRPASCCPPWPTRTARRIPPARRQAAGAFAGGRRPPGHTTPAASTAFRRRLSHRHPLSPRPRPITPSEALTRPHPSQARPWTTKAHTTGTRSARTPSPSKPWTRRPPRRPRSRRHRHQMDQPRPQPRSHRVSTSAWHHEPGDATESWPACSPASSSRP